MREPNVNVNLTKSDFTLSEQVTAEATSTVILGIDFARLFNKKIGGIEGGAYTIGFENVPVVGNFLGDKTSSYALYTLMNSNPGYDFIICPQYEKKVKKPILGIGFLMKKTTVKTTARLGKLVNK
jgi:hypothetical protein